MLGCVMGAAFLCMRASENWVSFVYEFVDEIRSLGIIDGFCWNKKPSVVFGVA